MLGKVLYGLAILVVAAAGVIGLLLFFNARDASTLTTAGSAQELIEGPGESRPDRGNGRRPAARAGVPAEPPTSGSHLRVPIRRDGGRLSDDQVLTALERGNVVLLAARPADVPDLRAQAELIAPPFAPELAEVGVAVVVGTHRAVRDGAVALAWRRILRVDRARDPALRAFADYWLGRGAVE